MDKFQFKSIWVQPDSPSGWVGSKIAFPVASLGSLPQLKLRWMSIEIHIFLKKKEKEKKTIPTV